MANITDIKTRIKSITDTRQTTKAMELISITKVRRAQENYDKNLLYYKSLIRAISDLLAHGDIVDDCDKYFKKPEGGKTVYIVISSDKGLAGGYNHNVLNLALQNLNADPNRIVVAYGKTAAEFLRRNQIEVDKALSSIGNPNLKDARDIAYDLVKQFNDGVVSGVTVIYTDMDDHNNQTPTSFEILPLEKEQFNQPSEWASTIMYDPNPCVVLEHLVPQYIVGLIYSVLLHANVSEHKSRMVAMQNATRNADEMLDMLRLEYNRARQASITNELLEIVSGSTAGK